MLSLKKQFLFVHIPKTAGTTFALILTRKFRGKKKLSFYSPQARKNYSALTGQIKNKYDLSYGHIPFMANQGLDRGIEYFTFLRSARERLLSSYRHIKGDGNHVIKKQINVANYSLKDFLKQGIVKNFDNLMTRYLSGEIDKPYLQINQEDLEVAKQNFDAHFNVFGITEYFDESLVLLAHFMNWSPLYYVKENKSTYKIDPKEFDTETEELIKKCIYYDEKLFEHALIRFKKILQENKSIVEQGLFELREGNKKYKMILSVRNRINLIYASLRKKIANV